MVEFLVPRFVDPLPKLQDTTDCLGDQNVNKKPD